MSASATRPLTAVPCAVRAALVITLAAQLSWGYARAPTQVSAQALPALSDTSSLRLFGLGEPDVLAKMVMLWLQAHDHQPGLSIPFAKLDYADIISWLDALLDLDGRFQYPLLSASRVYTQTPDPDRQRQMLEFVYRRFLEAPRHRWPWLAHGVYVAKHRIGDLQLALKYARALRLHVRHGAAPPWVSQMEIFVLEDLGEFEGAAIIIGGLLASGRLAGNSNELVFLQNRLLELERPDS